MTRIGINGFGRIGRLAVRAAWGRPELTFAHVTLGYSSGAAPGDLPELCGRLDGLAVRVPLLNASLTDCVFEVARPTTVEEINGLLQAAADGPLTGIPGYQERPLVSIDFKDDPRSGIVGAPSTMVTDGTQVKILAWYDNEWGYANRLVELARKIALTLP